MPNKLLSIRNHDRDASGMTYVYPVVSRRAGGVSVGINLNPNNACNWHCAYCQVPDLKRGSAPEIDLTLLEQELATMLDDIVNGSFMAERVPKECRVLRDVAISGDGEPTSCRNFDAIVELIINVINRFDLPSEVRLRLITNGSYVQKGEVQSGLRRMAEANGEVWIKVDSVTEEGIRRINGISASPELLFEQVKSAAGLCPTWIQTCMFAWDGSEPTPAEVDAYLDFVHHLQADSVPVEGVLLYGLARPSLQEESKHLGKLDEAWMDSMARRIELAGVQVELSL